MKKIINYHTHTYRCGHALGNEYEMVEAALHEGYQELGMSCHIALPHYRSHLLHSLTSIRSLQGLKSCIGALLRNGPKMRMPYNEKQDYLDALDYCQKHFHYIKIYKGFEAEYFEDYLDYYQSLLDSGEVDYLILGHHFHKHSIHDCYYGRKNLKKKDLLHYAEELEKAMDTGLFSYVAHPDLFLMGYGKIDDVSKEVILHICKKAKATNTPLELNAGGVRKGKVKMNGKDVYPYANAYFFQIASMIGNDIILGLDAHSPDQLSYEMYHYLEKLAEEYHLHVLNHIEFKKGKQ